MEFIIVPNFVSSALTEAMVFTSIFTECMNILKRICLLLKMLKLHFTPCRHFIFILVLFALIFNVFFKSLRH